MKYISVLFLFICVFMSSCFREKRENDEVVTIAEPPYSFPLDSKHVIFLTEGFSSDSVIVRINDSIYFSKVISTNESLGLAEDVGSYDSIITKLQVKVFENKILLVDTVYLPQNNSKYFFVDKKTNQLEIAESNVEPKFE